MLAVSTGFGKSDLIEHPKHTLAPWTSVAQKLQTNEKWRRTQPHTTACIVTNDTYVQPHVARTTSLATPRSHRFLATRDTSQLVDA